MSYLRPSCSDWSDILTMCTVFGFGTAGAIFSSIWSTFIQWTWPRWPRPILYFELERFWDNFANYPPINRAKWTWNRSTSKYNKGQGHVGQVHWIKVAQIELKMAPAALKHKIVCLVTISAQSEQLWQRYDNFYRFFEKMHYWSSSLNKSCL